MISTSHRTFVTHPFKTMSIYMGVISPYTIVIASPKQNKKKYFFIYFSQIFVTF